MADSYKLGNKTAELLARVIVLRDLKNAGKLDLSYGKKAELQEILGCGAMALGRTLSALEEIQPEIERLYAAIDPWERQLNQRLNTLIDLSKQRYLDMKGGRATAIPFEMYEQMKKAEEVAA